MDIRQKCEVVAANFHWWATTGTKYLEEDSWTDGRVRFIEERFSVYERVRKGIEAREAKFYVPLPVKQATYAQDFRVLLATSVKGFLSTEYVHILGHTGSNAVFLYRTKKKEFSLEHGTTVRGTLHFQKGKTLFAGYQWPTVAKASLREVSG